MALHVARRIPRHAQFRRVGLHNASTTSTGVNTGSTGVNTTSTGANAASAQQITSKASEGLSKVTSSAGSSLSRMSSATNSALSRIGGRTGRLISYVQSLIPPTIYYSKVGWELAKIVFQGQKMSPPSMSTFQAYMSPMINAMRNPSSLLTQTATSSAVQPTSILSRIRNINSTQMVGAGIVAAEVLGFFTVGQMIGRRKIIGYRTSKPAPDAQVHH